MIGRVCSNTNDAFCDVFVDSDDRDGRRSRGGVPIEELSPRESKEPVAFFCKTIKESSSLLNYGTRVKIPRCTKLLHHVA